MRKRRGIKEGTQAIRSGGRGVQKTATMRTGKGKRNRRGAVGIGTAGQRTVGKMSVPGQLSRNRKACAKRKFDGSLRCFLHYGK